MSVDVIQNYEEAFFSNHSIPAAQPEWLATVAALRGMHPQDVEHARILEMGCAGGPNLIPLAERYPDSTFVGIDLAESQTASAQRLVTHLGLTNIEFRHQNILDLGSELGTFDYIVAHGVYSWVDAQVRDKVLAICREHLAPQGVAYIAYNVYPGWHVYDMFRSMMNYQARGAETEQGQMLKGRSLLNFLKASLAGDESPHAQLFTAEIDPILNQSDAAIRHDLLSETNFPVYFRQFVAHAKSHALKFLGDCTVDLQGTDVLTPELEQQLHVLTTDPLEKEQYRDMVKKKAFRQTLLCHEAVDLQPSNTASDAFREFYVSGRIRPETPNVSLNSIASDRFVNAIGATVSTAVPLIKAALLRLSDMGGESIRFADLVSDARTRLESAAKGPPPKSEQAEINRLEESLRHLCVGGFLELRMKPHSYNPVPGPRPAASPLARWQAEHARAVTNRKHVPLRLSYFDQQVLQLLNGERDVQQIIEQLFEWALAGKLLLWEGEQRVESPERVRQYLEVLLPASLARLGENAFLVR